MKNQDKIIPQEWECGTGWYNLYQPIVDEINSINESLPEEEKIRIYQIKEKFGGLRIYVSHSNPFLDAKIEEAENRSYKTCEQCGATNDTGLLYVGGWIYNCCRDCARKILKRRMENSYFNSDWKGKIFWEDTNTNKRYLVDSSLNFAEIKKDKVE